MKKLVLIAAVFAAVASVNVSAQVYAGATVGATDYNLDCSGVTSCDTKGTGFKMLIGYQISPNIGLEASYFDLGKISGKEMGVNINGGATGVDFAAVGRVQLGHDFGLFARLGVANIEGKITGTQGTNSTTLKHTSTQPVFGVGATYNINTTLRVRAEVEQRRAKVIRDGDSVNVTSYSIGLENSF